MAHWNTLESISQMPNCANHPIYPTSFIPMENIFLELKIWKKKPQMRINTRRNIADLHALFVMINIFPPSLKCKPSLDTFQSLYLFLRVCNNERFLEPQTLDNMVQGVLTWTACFILLNSKFWDQNETRPSCKDKTRQFHYITVLQNHYLQLNN